MSDAVMGDEGGEDAGEDAGDAMSELWVTAVLQKGKYKIFRAAGLRLAAPVSHDKFGQRIPEAIENPEHLLNMLDRFLWYQYANLKSKNGLVIKVEHLTSAFVSTYKDDDEMQTL